MAPISTLTVRLSAQIAEFQSEFRNATKTAEQFAGNFEGIATRAAAVGTFIGNIATKIASSLASAFGQGLKDSVRLSAEMSNAFTGLSSVAKAFGRDTDAVAQAAKALSADGLIPIRNSAQALKNLLSTGFGLPEAIKLLNVAKDSAAFNRQGMLSMGDAVERFTQGIKFNNSALTDSTGLGKNLSQVMRDAGLSLDAAGRAASDAGVRQAILNGFIKEGAAFAGDAAKLTETYSGQVSRLETAYNNLLATFGDAITQNASVARTIGFISDALFDLNTGLLNNKTAFNLVSDAVLFLVRAFSAMTEAIDLVQIIFHGAQMASNRLFEAFANIGIAIFKVAERALELQKYLDPVNFQRHAAGAEEARKAYTFLEGAAQGLRDASRDARSRTEQFSATLQTIKGRADELARELATTRGKTIELGAAATSTGRSLGDAIGGGAKKATDAIKQLDAAIARSLNGLRVGDLGSVPGIKVDLSKLVSIIPPKIPDIRGMIVRGFDGVTNLPGIKIDIKDLIAPPPPPTFWQKYFGGMVGVAKTAIGAVADVFEQGFESIGQFAKDFARQFAEDFLGTILSYVPVVGDELKRLAKPIIDFFADLFDRNKGRDAVVAFADSFGGFDALHSRLLELGAEGERLWINLTQGVGRNNPEQAAAAIEDITEALDALGTEAERAQRRLDALGRAVEGVNRRAELFAAPFRELVDAMRDADGSELDALAVKLSYTAQVGQDEFERLGTFVGATFAALVNETGDAIGAIQQLGPAFQTLQDGVNEFGLTSTATIDSLLRMFGLVNDATTGPILQSIQATSQIFLGLQDAGYMTADLFQTVATDIGASFRDLEAAGGDVATAMALSQPVLQALWEAQQTYSAATDETTAAILRQAEEQGLVGDHMRDVNERILQVLIAIADVFGAQIPEAMRTTVGAGRQAATDIEDNFRTAGRSIRDNFEANARQAADSIREEFRGIRVDPIIVPIAYEAGDFPEGITVPALAHGGVVTRPTLALVGEAGPEAVVPLSQLGSVSGPETSTSTVIIEADGRTLAEVTVPHIPGVVQRYGLV